MPGRLLHFPRRLDPSPSPDSPPAYVFSEIEGKLLAKVKRAASPRGRASLDMDALRSIGGRHKAERKSATKLETAKPAKMQVQIESPPLLFLHSPQNSPGCLFSAQLKVNVTEPDVVFDKLDIKFLATTTTKEPVAKQCPSCTSQTTELKKWSLLTEPKKLKQGEHCFPFSHMLPGHLPASFNGPLAMLDYHLSAEAVTSTGETITFGRSIDIRRAIIPGPDKQSIRIFPPTNLTSTVNIPNVVHPIGDFPVEMRISGLVEEKRAKSTTRWKLRKLNWRIEEQSKFISPACAKHAQRVGGDGKGILHEDTRTIGTDDVKTGWKTDLDADNITVEFQARVDPTKNPVCDVRAQNGLEIKHFLVLEIVVAEEFSPDNKPNQVTPTGAARVLRTQFHLTLTERAGLGISWDEEQPPMYEDVPASPPTYTQEIASRLDEDVESLHLHD